MYPLHVKQQARRWHHKDRLKLSQVLEKLQKAGNFAPSNTACSWWAGKVMAKVKANPPDR